MRGVYLLNKEELKQYVPMIQTIISQQLKGEYESPTSLEHTELNPLALREMLRREMGYKITGMDSQTIKCEKKDHIVTIYFNGFMFTLNIAAKSR